MGKFKSYAEKLNETARAAFVQYTLAAEELEKAQAAARETPMPTGGTVSDEYYRKALDAAQALRKAQDAEKAARDAMQTAESKMRDLRAKLYDAVRDEYYPYGKDIDEKDMQVLQSGIMTADEYRRMYEVAKATENWTMCRMIGKYAGEYGNQREKAGALDEAQEMRALQYDSELNRAAPVLDAFESLIETFGSMQRNPHIIPRWNELTAEIIESF